MHTLTFKSWQVFRNWYEHAIKLFVLQVKRIIVKASSGRCTVVLLHLHY